MPSKKISGLHVAAPTPMRVEGSLNLKPIEKLADRWVEEGVSGVYVGGPAGEFSSLTLEERQRLAAWWAEILRGKPLKLILHVGHNCLADARQLAVHAEKINADAIAAVAPAYIKASSTDRLVACCETVAAAAPRLPFYFDDTPVTGGPQLPSPEFISLGRKRIPTLAGLIFNNPDLSQYQPSICAGGGNLNIIFGRDEMLLAGLALGANTGIGPSLACAAPIFHRLFNAFVSGDHQMARVEQARVVETVECCRRYGLPCAFKAMMAMVGLECGPPRLPLVALSPSQFTSLRNDLDRIGFFDWISAYHAHARTPIPKKLAGLPNPCLAV